MRIFDALYLGSWPVPSSSLDLGRQIIVLAGQSNADGRGNVSVTFITGGLDVHYPNVPFIYQYADSPANPLVWTTASADDLQPKPNGDMGIELALGRYLDRLAPDSFAIVKMAIGGSSLHENWHPTASYPLAGPPNLFTQFITYVSSSQLTLSGAVAAVNWIQGETDAGIAAQAPLYSQNMGTLIDAFRVQFPGTPWVFNLLNISGAESFVDTVRTQQGLVTGSVTGTSMFNCDGLALTGLHFFSDGLVTLGNMFGAATAKALGIANPPRAKFIYSTSGRTVTLTDISDDHAGTIVTWLWDLGDGQTSSLQNVVYAYATDGCYTVRLTVTDDLGQVGTTTWVVAAIQTPTWSLDHAVIGVPATTHEFRQLIHTCSLTASWSPPASLYLCQDSTASLQDAIDTRHLAPLNSPQYRTTLPTWDRFFVTRVSTGVTQHFVNATFPNTTGSSALVLGYVRISKSSANAAVMSYGAAAANEFEITANANTVRLRAGDNSRNSVKDHFTDSAVHPFVLKYDVTNRTNVLYSDIELTNNKFIHVTGTSFTMTVGVAADAGYSSSIGYAAVWTGSYAERSDKDVRGLLQALGWTIRGYGGYELGFDI